ncbi:hypothetical protein L2E82_35975 [Cichorium intybus]|uniref:Uncharacterized protein n=1 Tax=Cichorium intybus TaxID=13427 RepID=A0ACB9BQC9_CICIN|nr:hypothetical protein L2E82_35975 [Cichorium intybus]
MQNFQRRSKANGDVETGKARLPQPIGRVKTPRKTIVYVFFFRYVTRGSPGGFGSGLRNPVSVDGSTTFHRLSIPTRLHRLVFASFCILN